jgi:hypothetical protein
MKYYNNCTTLEDLKAEYHKLAKLHHPDCNLAIDTTEIMKAVNAEYAQAFERCKLNHKTMEGEAYTKDTGEEADEFPDIIEKMIHFQNCAIEIIGSWIWVSGETYSYKGILKGLGFKWASKKKAWSFHRGECSRSHKFYSLDEIRASYGTEKVDTKPAASIA